MKTILTSILQEVSFFMKRSSYEQFAIVKSDSASLFEKQLNEKVLELRNNYPEVHFSENIPLYAHIKYRVDTETPDSISEEYELVGARFTCAQCPYFEPVLRKDGEEDPRFKWGECPHSELGRVLKSASACDRLYEAIHEGGVKLCFTK